MEGVMGRDEVRVEKRILERKKDDKRRKKRKMKVEKKTSKIKIFCCCQPL